MPVRSEAQRRAMYAAAAGKSTLGIPQKVGAEFIAESHGIRNLPKRKGEKPKPRMRSKPFGSLAP